MKKCWAMERAMAASNHKLVSGPITSRDWFSLKLGRGGGERVREGRGGGGRGTEMDDGVREREGGRERPVEGIQHLYGDEDRESHGHRVEVRECLTALYVREHFVLTRTLKMVTLGRV